LHPDKSDKENEADDDAQFHFSSHGDSVSQRARGFAIDEECVNQHDRADPVNASIQPSQRTERSRWPDGSFRVSSSGNRIPSFRSHNAPFSPDGPSGVVKRSSATHFFETITSLR
jgi:hypothetical protein